MFNKPQEKSNSLVHEEVAKSLKQREKKANIFVRLRRKFYLPFKYSSTKKRIRENYNIKSLEEIQERMERENKELFKLQRLRDTRGIERQEDKLEILNWLTK